jgi:hypothetical protein
MRRGALWTSDAPYDAPIQPTITEIPVGQGNETPSPSKSRHQSLRTCTRFSPATPYP